MIQPRHAPTHLYSDADTRPTLDLRRPSWMSDAACRGSAHDFTDEKNKATRDACLQICGRCPVRVPCLDWALELPDQVGIAGGTDSAARRAIRANRKNQRKDTSDAEPT